MYSVLIANYIQVPFQLLVSVCIFWIGMKKREHAAVKIVVGIFLQFLCSYLWFALLNGFAGSSLFPYVILYVGYAALNLLPTCLAFEVSLSEAIFVLSGGYAVEHISFTMSKLILYLLHIPYNPHGSLPMLILTRYVIFILGSALMNLLLIRKLRKPEGYRNGDLRIGFLALLVMLMAIGISVYWSYPAEYTDTVLGSVICPMYGAMSCLLILWMCFNIFDENTIRRENEMMEQLLKMSDTQQKSAQEAIDIINIKVHDLKHQIKALEKMEDRKDRKEYLEEIREAVSIYDAIFHTGNKPLDYVLREKSLIFDEKNIDFDCLADGTAISFMTPADIYALMGNILDNALEAVLQEAEEERFISLQIKHHRDMVLIHTENRCSRELKFKDDLPLTTKEDQNRHGFGTRSIRFISEKYGGTVRTNLKDGVFSLNILIPFTDEAFS